MERLIRRNRLKLNKDLRTIEKRKFFSPALYCSYKVTAPLVIQYIYGKTIDVGCGDMPYKNLLSSQIRVYDTFDTERKVPGVKYIGDIHNMSKINDNSYDSILCLQVLEHVKNPTKALKELYRILKLGGVIILSVPHLSRLHEEPNDFYRYTKHGLNYLFDSVGFKTKDIKQYGGIFSFLGHQLSSIFVLLFWHIPIINRIVFFINKWFVVKVCYWLDKIFDKKKILALGYVIVAKK